MKKTILSLMTIFSLQLSIYAQTSSLPDSLEVPPPPVVSALQATVTGVKVKLDWIPAPGIEGENIILRAKQPITSANYSSAERRGSVSAGTGTYTDTIDENTGYYFAILTRDADGTYYDFFLPACNSLLVPVQTRIDAPVQAVSFSSFDAMLRNDAVIITWNASLKQKKLVLYRSTSPFSAMSSLLPAIVVSAFTDDGAPYVDYPVPGVPYYYAVLDEESIRSGTAHFEAGNNTNRIPVEISSMYEKIKRTSLPVLRPMPLPWLNPTSKPETVARVFSPETEKKIAALTGTVPDKKSLPALKPFIFGSDRDGSATSEGFALKTILEKNFSAGSYDNAIAELTDFLAIRRSDETTARTRFYLGEAWCLKGEYPKALNEFLMAEDRYYNQSREWIQYVLDRMVD